jgi:class 3 adenylate cyclase
MLPGTKELCVFGFCDIRNFTDTTEVLEHDIMYFVNEIGDIVHSLTYKYGGAPNKNVGDAFLLVWKFREEDVAYDNITDDVEIIPSNSVS